ATAESRRHDPVHELAQLDVGALCIEQRFVNELRRCTMFAVEFGLGELKGDHRMHQPLLSAVVDIALESTTSLVCRRDESRARDREPLCTEVLIELPRADAENRR